MYRPLHVHSLNSLFTQCRLYRSNFRHVRVMGCIHSRLQKLLGPRPARQMPEGEGRPAVQGAHPRHGGTAEAPRGTVNGDVPRLPPPPPRTPSKPPCAPRKPRYSPPTATSSMLFQQPGGYRFGDSQRALIESGTCVAAAKRVLSQIEHFQTMIMFP